MKTIQLKSSAKGEITLKEDEIIFNDKSARTNKYLFLILPHVLFIMGVALVYSAIMDMQPLFMVLKIISGTLLLLIPALTFSINFKRTNKSVIKLVEIRKAKLSYIFGQIYVDFILKDNVIRRVYYIRNHRDWISLREYLKEKGVAVSTKF